MREPRTPQCTCSPFEKWGRMPEAELELALCTCSALAFQHWEMSSFPEWVNIHPGVSRTRLLTNENDDKHGSPFLLNMNIVLFAPFVSTPLYIVCLLAVFVFCYTCEGKIE